MLTKMNRRTFIGTSLTFGALCSLSPSRAFGLTAAEMQSEVQRVKAQLDAMADDVYAAGDKYHQAMDAYDTATAKVEECQATISEMSAKITSLQNRLESRATSMYRSGSMSYLDVLMGVKSFDDFATVWDTLNTLNADDADLVAETKIAKSTLESAQDELIEQQDEAAVQLSSAESYMTQVLAKQDEYDSLYNSLSSEYQDMIAAREAAEAEASARAAQDYSPSSMQENTGGSGGNTSTSEITTDGDNTAAPSDSGGNAGGTSPGYAPDLPTNGSVVDYAYSRLGCAYVWGASGPDEFDCSGLVAWCYAKIGIDLPHYTESMYECAAARFSPSEAEPGDVLYKPGHVGISTGGISAVEAMGTRWGVVESCRGGWTAALRF